VAYEFRLPDLGEGLTEGEVARWRVAEGDEIEVDGPLVEVQTDKTTVEIPSPAAGTVLRIVVSEGEVAPVGSVLVVIGEAGEQLIRPVAGEAEPEPDPARPIAVVAPEPLAAVRATPLVRQLARETGVDLARVGGSGPAGRITEADVRAAARHDGGAQGHREPIRGIRRLIVEQVTRTHREIPAVTFVEECDFTEVERATLVAATLSATALSLREFPELNARLDGDEIVYLDRYDIGLAVQTEQGLVVPVVRGCDLASVLELDREVARLSAAARDGTLQPEELRDSTFTLTSAGKLGGLIVTPLINHPEVAILGLHRIAPRPVVRAGEIVVREVGNVSVTFDHRVVDGARAAGFCLAVIDRLQSGLPPSSYTGS
jgi:pyruvate/2-oxoglutarate dehydrogenase complex dihydrolipoamide acyltransferase (E2) component